mmetsp:Transcript_4464/g.5539  ORF Transcript_4464/g.5539 Transcript_4464/m.5539 type:complete len:187 (+) Transcript_4464:254-814(+)
MKLPPPTDPINNATCRDPSTFETVAEIDEDLLEGTWYIVEGWNPLYDCFHCLMESFEVADGKVTYTANFNMIVTNGTEIWPTIVMNGDIVDGTIVLKGLDNGLPDHQTWNLLLLTENTLVVYYCGGVMDSWHFEGFLIMSKTMELSKERDADIVEIMGSLDIKDSEMCKLSPAHSCSAPTFHSFTQ